jgi:hypothetical protein
MAAAGSVTRKVTRKPGVIATTTINH